MANQVSIKFVVDAKEANEQLKKISDALKTSFNNPSLKAAMQLQTAQLKIETARQVADIKAKTAQELNDKKMAYQRELAEFKTLQKQKAEEAKKAAKTAAGVQSGKRGLLSTAFGGGVPDPVADTARFKLAAIGGAVGIATAAIGKAVNLMKGYVQASNQQEVAIARMNQTLQNTGRAIPTKEMLAFASQLQANTTFGDEVVMSAIQMAAQYKQLSDGALKEVVRVAADVASVTGKPLEESANNLAMALAKPEAAGKKLKAMNILLTKSEEQQIKALTDVGKTAEAQALILDKVKNQYKGQAEALANTSAGMQTQIANLSSDMQENLGDAIKEMIAPFQKDMIDTLKNTLKWWEKNKDTIIKTAKIIGIVISTLVKTTIGYIKTWVGNIGLAFDIALDSVFAWVAGVKNGFNVVIDLFTSYGKVMRKLLTGDIKGAIQEIQDSFILLKGDISKSITQGNEAIEGIFIKAIEFGNTARESILDPIKDGIQSIADALYITEKSTQRIGKGITDIGGTGTGEGAAGSYNRLRTKGHKTNAELVQEYIDKQHQLQEELKTDLSLQERMTAELELQKSKADSLEQAFMPFQDMLVNIVTAAESFGDALKNAIAGFKNQIIQLVISSAFKKFISVITGGSFDFLGSLKSFFGFSSGGMVPGYAGGGMVYAAGGFRPRGTDTVPAMLTPGEAVLNRNAVNLIGGAAGVDNLNNGNLGSGNFPLVVNQNIGYIIGDEQQAVEINRTSLAKANRTLNNLIRK